jgi:hypothetical protein
MVFLFALFTALFLHASPTSDVPYTAVESAFVAGDASKIVAFGKNQLLLSVLDKDGAYSQSQSIQILKDFFTKKPATSFKFSFKGPTSDGATAIGTYLSKGENFRVTIKWDKLNSEFKIESITISKS